VISPDGLADYLLGDFSGLAQTNASPGLEILRKLRKAGVIKMGYECQKR